MLNNMYSIIRCVVVMALWILSDGSRHCCQDGWTMFNGSCYYFTKDKMTFSQAQNYCTKRGANLVAIETRSEQLFLENYLKMTIITEPWISLTDAAREGQWIWGSTGDNLGFTNWVPGQPNDGRRANCVIITDEYGNFQWADRPCEAELHPPICEYK